MHTKFLDGKPKTKRPLSRHKLKWEGNCKMGIKETGCECVD